MPYFGRAPAAIGTIANVIEGDLKVKGTISGESINDKFAFDTAADLDDHFLIEAGGTDGSGTNAGDNILIEDLTTSVIPFADVDAGTSASGQLLTSGGAGVGSSFTTVTIPDADAGTFSWVMNGQNHHVGTGHGLTAGGKSLSAELTQLKVSGFTGDAGYLNVLFG